MNSIKGRIINYDKEILGEITFDTKIVSHIHVKRCRIQSGFRQVESCGTEMYEI